MGMYPIIWHILFSTYSFGYQLSVIPVIRSICCHSLWLSVIYLSLAIRVVFSASKNVVRGLKLLRVVLTMRNSPTRKYDNFSNDQQGKDTDKNSLDSQDTASVVSSLFKLLIFVCVRDVIDLLMY